MVQVDDVQDALQELEMMLLGKRIPRGSQPPYLTYASHNHLTGTTPVSSALKISSSSLEEYLKQHHNIQDEGGCDDSVIVCLIKGSSAAAPVIRQFSHGQSNPTYYIACGKSELVLRKKPVRKRNIKVYTYNSSL